MTAIKNLFVEIITNLESVVILSLSAIGLTTLMAELPFHFAVPAIIDAAMIVPVLSVFIILGLITIMQWRFRPELE